MVKTYIYIYSILTLLTFLYPLTNFFIPINYGWTYYIDSILRLNLNDTLFNHYFFFWTNFYYLPSFYFLLFNIITLTLNNSTTFTLLFITNSTLILYNLELLDFMLTNTNSWVCDESRLFLNTLLTNTLNKYHPFIFYISTLYLYVYWLNKHYSYLQNSIMYRRTSEEVDTRRVVTPLYIVLTLTLFMGGWWALQEGSWGGWWDWDPSEMLGLMFIVALLVLIHLKPEMHSFYYYYWRYGLLACFTCFFYFLVQLNFEFVSHNFGIKSFFMFNNNSIFLEALLIITIYIAYRLLVINLITFNYVVILCNSTDFPCKVLAFNVISFFTLLVGIYFFLSFLPLLNYFTANLWTLDLLSIKNVISLLNIIVLLVFIFYFSKNFCFKISFITTIFLHNVNPINLIFFLQNLGKPFVHWVHITLIIFFYYNYTLINLQASINYFTTPLINYYHSNHLYYSSPAAYICDGFLFDTTNQSIDRYGNTLIKWNSCSSSNVSDIESFLLLFDTNALTNYYNISNSLSTVAYFIFYPGVQHLLLLFLLLMLLLGSRVIYSNYVLIY